MSTSDQQFVTYKSKNGLKCKITIEENVKQWSGISEQLIQKYGKQVDQLSKVYKGMKHPIKITHNAFSITPSKSLCGCIPMAL